MTYDPFKEDAAGGLDLTGFDTAKPKPVDRSAAEAARRAGDEAGFTSRRSGDRTRPAAKAKPSGKARMSEIAPKAVIQGTKAQFNMLAPAELIIRFKTLQRRRGDDAQWQTLAAALDALEAEGLESISPEQATRTFGGSSLSIRSPGAV